MPLSHAGPSALHALSDWLRVGLLSSRGLCLTSSSTHRHTLPHPFTHVHTFSGCPGVRLQTLLNLFFLTVNWVKASSTPFLMCKWVWHRGTPAHHSTGTFTGHLRVLGRRLWPVYGSLKEGREGVRLSVPTWIREEEWRKKIPELIIAVEAWRPFVSPLS